MKNKNWTPVDAFVTEYGFRIGATFTYQPGSGEATMNTGRGMDLDDLKALIKSIEHHELQINIDGKIFVYDPEAHGEERETPDELENEAIGKCPECDAPATHPSGLCRDCHQSKLEAEELDTLASETGEDEEIAEAVEEPESEEENVVIIE